ncbi:MAG: hypothetical protein ABI405_08405 [Parafilimonas sp.]
MNVLKRYYFFLILFALPILLIQNSGCTKEYSFEGAPTDTIPADTITTDTTDTVIYKQVITFPQCGFCNVSDAIDTGQWSFKTSDSYLCGSFTNSGFFNGNSKTAFTFFGPSACSVDTGIVVSVYLPVPLDQDRYNLSTKQTAFYYYDHNSPTDILASHPPTVFSVTVQSFIYATNIATGTFSGTVFTATGDSVYISNGRFKAVLH